MRANQIRKIHINNDVWCWTTKGNCEVLLYDKTNNNQKIKIDCNPMPAEIKEYILKHIMREKHFEFIEKEFETLISELVLESNRCIAKKKTTIEDTKSLLTNRIMRINVFHHNFYYDGYRVLEIDITSQPLLICRNPQIDFTISTIDYSKCSEKLKGYLDRINEERQC
jgi:uncharacterized protein YPO0396